MGGARTDWETRKAIIRRLREPGTCADIAREFGVGRSLVNRILNDSIERGTLAQKYRGRGPFRRAVTQICGEEREAIIRRLREPGTCADIAREFGYENHKVIRIMNEAISEGKLSKRFKRYQGGFLEQDREKNRIRNAIRRKLNERLSKNGYVSVVEVAEKTGSPISKVIRVYEDLQGENISQQKKRILAKLPKKIRGKYLRLGSADRELFMDIVGRYPNHFFGGAAVRSAVSASAKSGKVRSLVLEANGYSLSSEVTKIAQAFVSKYDEMKTLGHYTLRSFFYKWDGEGFCRRDGRTSGLIKGVTDYAGKLGLSFDEAVISILDEDLGETVEDIAKNRRLAREAARSFVSAYEESRMDSRYRLHNFLRRWKAGSGFEHAQQRGDYYGLVRALSDGRGAGKREEYIPRFLEAIRESDEDLAAQVEDIVSERKLAREAAELFIDLYDECDPKGEKYGLSSSYSLYHILTFWNGEDFSGDEAAYGSFFQRIKNRVGSGRREDYIPAFLDMLDDDPGLRRDVEDIVSGERYRRELREDGGLESTVAEYLARVT